MRKTSRHGRRSAAPVAKGAHPRGALAVTAILTGAVVVALTATAGSYALWNGQQSVNAATISSGSTVLTINGVTNYTVPLLNTTTLYPGRSVFTPVPLAFANTGSTPLSFTIGAPTYASATAVSGYLTMALTSATTCVASTAGVIPSSPAVTVAAGSTVSMCLEVRLAASAPASVQGTAAVFTLPVDYTQVRPS
jgi:hypothetical protein